MELFLSQKTSRNLGTAQCLFHPKGWGWASRNVGVGEAGKGDISLHKRVLSHPWTEWGGVACLGIILVQAGIIIIHEGNSPCVNTFSWNIYRCSLWLKVWTGSDSSHLLSSNSCCINCAEIALTSSRGYPLCVSVSLYRKDNKCYYVSQWECVTGGISVKRKAENLRFPLNLYFNFQRRMTSLICFKNKNQLPINLKHMLFFLLKRLRIFLSLLKEKKIMTLILLYHHKNVWRQLKAVRETWCYCNQNSPESGKLCFSFLLGSAANFALFLQPYASV